MRGIQYNFNILYKGIIKAAYTQQKSYIRFLDKDKQKFSFTETWGYFHNAIQY